MVTRRVWLMLAMGLACAAKAADDAGQYVWPVDQFTEGSAVENWQTSMSPEYYRGGEGRKGLDIVNDPERGPVLSCGFGFTDPGKSEPVFITRRLDPEPARLDVVAVRFYAKLTAPIIDPEGGFILRLRTSETAHDNWNVQEILGREFPVNEWVRVEIETGIGSNVRNIWGKVFGHVRQMTFRLDDIDTKNGSGALLLDDIEMVLKQPPETVPYTPTASARAEDDGVTRVLLMQHRAAGFYPIEEALRDLSGDLRVTRLDYRGLHFPLFGFPETRDRVLAHDLIVMLDVDPFVLTRAQTEWLADAVVSGSGMVLLGGSVTLTDSKDFKQPLRAVMPVDFELGTDALGGGVPRPATAHALNAGFDPAGLGLTGRMHALTPGEGAIVSWAVEERPLVISKSFGKGRVAVINTRLDVSRAEGGDWFTSALSDDMMRRTFQWALDRVPEKGIDALKLPEKVVDSGTARIEVGAGGADRTDMRARITEGAGEIALRQEETGRFLVDVSVPPSPQVSREVIVRVERLDGDRVADWRDVSIDVVNPLDLDVIYPYHRRTFAPGYPVAVEVEAVPRWLPNVDPGSSTTVACTDGWDWRIDNVADVWVMKDGQTYHDQGGPAEVEVERTRILPPAWTVTGILRATRPGEGTVFGDDGRVARCKRGIGVRQDGSVEIDSTVTFLRDLTVHRMPLTVSLPVSRFAGVPYRYVQDDGTEVEGVFPVAPTRGNLFSGKGGELRILTPKGEMRLRVTTPGLRVWARDLRQYDMTTYRIEVEAPVNERDVKAGEEYTIGLALTGPAAVASGALPIDALSFEAEMVDPASGFTWELPLKRADGASAHFEGDLPNLNSGDYEMVVRASAAGAPVAESRTSCAVVDPLDRRWFFPIMSIIGLQADGHWLDPAGIRGRVDELVQSGFNTAAITGVSSFLNWSPSMTTRLKAYSERYAQQQGMATTFEYSHFTTYNRNGVLDPCPFSGEGRKKLLNHFRSRIEAGNRTPRLLTAKVVDEPYVRPDNLDYCEHCQRAFRERYGLELKRVDEQDSPYQRWAMADFLGAAVGELFAQEARTVAELGARFDLLLTYMATGLGYQSPLRTQQDAVDWSEHVRWADFDVYPYFYPRSQRLRMVQAGFTLSAMKDVARLHDIPWGFYVELDDRNWPFQKNPKEASAECAYTAVAHGADYLNTFIHRIVSTGTQARPERWREAAEAFRLIRRCGPVLTEMPALRSPLAVYYPDAHEFVNDGYERPDYLLGILKGTYGDVDVHREEALVEEGTVPYAAMILVKAETLHADAVPLLTRWLRQGGVLFTDGLPRTDHRGEAIRWDLEPAERRTMSAGDDLLSCDIQRLNEGTVVVFQQDVNEKLKDAIEADELVPEDVWMLRQALAEILGAFCPPPNVRVTYRETDDSVDTVEAGMRANDDGMLLTVVNHQAAAQTVDVELFRSDVDWLVDMATMETIAPVSTFDGGFRLKLQVPNRGARIIAGYRRRPTGISIDVSTEGDAAEKVIHCETTIKAGWLRKAPGGVLLEVNAFDPDGAPVSRFSKRLAPRSGEVTLTWAVPVNAPAGTYRFEAVLPQTGERDTASVVLE